MASRWNSGSDREATLRRVAIVLSTLPDPIAERLLGSIGADANLAVRQTMSNLSDIDPLEQKRALQAFKVMIQQQPKPGAASGEGDSLQLQGRSPDVSIVPSQEVSQPKTEATPPESGCQSPLEFLRDVADEDLARLLGDEHPQTIAFVLASISPGQAARVLPILDAPLQQETLSRIGRLGEIPEPAVSEVAEHFRARLDASTSSDHHALGRKALEAIISAMTDQPATGSDSVETAGRTEIEQERPATTEDSRFMSHPEVDLKQRLRIAEETWPESSTEMGSQGPDAIDEPSTIPFPGREREALVSEAFESTDQIQQHLIQLSPSDLCEALGRVDTRDAMLALCGLPVETVDSALAVLPRSQARKVRIKMNSLNSIHLRDIDQAKERVARASLRTGASLGTGVSLGSGSALSNRSSMAA